MTAANLDRNPVEVLADEFSARFRSGEYPSVSEYTEKYPQYAEEIEDLFPSIVMMEQLKRRENADRGAIERRERFRDQTIKQIGDFDILREVGRGGMGVVYEAVQRSLGRKVALKLLTAGTVSSPKQLQRFQREARAAAALHHTNIVPVFGVGSQDGMHYYVMQFINGCGLDVVTAQLKNSVSLDDVDAQRSDISVSALVAAQALLDGRFDRPMRGGSSTRDVEPIMPNNNNEVESAEEQRTAGKVADETVVAEKPISEVLEAEAPLRMADTVEIKASEIPDNISHRKLGSRYWKSVARIGEQVADALQYAHTHGVIHRDIKPANLVLDTQGIVWITDFGLAKHIDQEELTHTGDIVGTLRYMAPEQFNGQSDERGDVYSLGLTLYELVTLRPAFDADNRQKLIQQLMQSRPPRPRSINREIPSDLETIILKAIAPDAKDRYTTAAQMAEDLNFYAEDLPIRARRHTTVERFWRWSRRNPALAALSAAAVALLILVAVVATIGNINTSRALAKAKTQEKNARQSALQAESAKQAAEENLSLAIQSLDNMTQRLRARAVPQSIEYALSDEERTAASDHRLTPADAEMLRSVLAFYYQFVSRNQGDARLLAKTAEMHCIVGEIEMRLGNFDGAEAAYQQAIEMYQLLAVKFPREITYVLAEARTLNEMGISFGTSGQIRQSVEAHVKAKDLLQSQPGNVAKQAEIRFELAKSCNYLGSVSSRSGLHRGDTQTTFPESGPPRNPAEHPSDSDESRNLRKEFESRIAKRIDEHLGLAMNLLLELVAESPENPDYRFTLAQCYRNHYLVALRKSDLTAAANALTSGVAILNTLVKDYPGRYSYKFELADTLTLTSQSLPTCGDGTHCREHLDRAVEIGGELVAAFPNAPEYRALLANSLSKLAYTQHQNGELEAADATYEDSIAYHQQLADEFPTHALYQVAFAQALNGRGDMKREWGQLVQDEELLNESRAILRDAATRFDAFLDKTRDPAPYYRIRSAIYTSLAETLGWLGERQMANEAKRMARPPKPRLHRGPARSNTSMINNNVVPIDSNEL